MEEIIEMSIDTPDGVVDCRLEPQRTDNELICAATILYPNIVDGFSRSEVHCIIIRFDADINEWYFDPGTEGIHPKIKKLEKEIVERMANLV